MRGNQHKSARDSTKWKESNPHVIERDCTDANTARVHKSSRTGKFRLSLGASSGRKISVRIGIVVAILVAVLVVVFARLV